MVWWICFLLLLASAINYMDRQTLSNTSERITREFKLTEAGYGSLEMAFGLAFATGATLFGIIADRTNVKWLYPIVLLLWSTMGFATGLVTTFSGLLACRLLLGLFEAGHWPCALKTTQRLLPSSKRTLGNSVLQSGTAIGAMVTPLIINRRRLGNSLVDLVVESRPPSHIRRPTERRGQRCGGTSVVFECRLLTQIHCTSHHGDRDQSLLAPVPRLDAEVLDSRSRLQ
jgi:sugar phosphate permease